MIQSVSRALDLTEEVARCVDWVGVRELARRTGLRVATAQNLLKTLVQKGVLEFDEARRGYRIGLGMWLLTERVEPWSRMAAFGGPYVTVLFKEFRETTGLYALLRERMVVVDSMVSSEALTVAHADRVIEHPHCLASGKVLLAYADSGHAEHYAAGQPLAELGPNVATTPEELLAELRRIREQGYAESIDARGSGVGAVAAPVLSASGRVLMALGCSAPLARFDGARRLAVRTRLLEVAAGMSAALVSRANPQHIAG